MSKIIAALELSIDDIDCNNGDSILVESKFIIYKMNGKFELMVVSDDYTEHYEICADFAEYLTNQLQVQNIETKLMHIPLKKIFLGKDQDNYMFCHGTPSDEDEDTFNLTPFLAVPKTKICAELLAACILQAYDN